MNIFTYMYLLRLATCSGAFILGERIPFFFKRIRMCVECAALLVAARTSGGGRYCNYCVPV